MPHCLCTVCMQVTVQSIWDVPAGQQPSSAGVNITAAPASAPAPAPGTAASGAQSQAKAPLVAQALLQIYMPERQWRIGSMGIPIPRSPGPHQIGSNNTAVDDWSVGSTVTGYALVDILADGSLEPAADVMGPGSLLAQTSLLGSLTMEMPSQPAMDQHGQEQAGISAAMAVEEAAASGATGALGTAAPSLAATATATPSNMSTAASLSSSSGPPGASASGGAATLPPRETQLFVGSTDDDFDDEQWFGSTSSGGSRAQKAKQSNAAFELYGMVSGGALMGLLIHKILGRAAFSAAHE